MAKYVGKSIQTICPKCGLQEQEVVCHNCGFDIAKESMLSVGSIPEVDIHLHNVNYAEWLKSKNIYVWIKD